jgi:4-hydroxybutyryl-CoA dehydratase/vinylacetyl-CoA-Delta-isomerase
LFFTDFTCSAAGASINYAGVHGGGSPIMEQIAITSQFDMKLRKNIVKKLAGMNMD